MSQHRGARCRRPSRTPAFLLILLLAGAAAAALAWKAHPEWFKGLRLPGRPPQARPRSSAAPAPPTSPEHDTVAGEIYCLKEVNGEARLVAVPRALPAASPARAALLALLSGEAPAGCRSPLPDGVALRGVVVKEHVAVANFSRELVSNFRGGSSNEAAVVYAIVDTLTSLPGVEKVQLLVEGQPLDTLGGHLDLSEPLTPNQDLVVQRQR